MAMKAKHAFGSLEGIDAALTSGKIDNYDILFVKDENGKPYVGWIDRDGNKVIVDDSAELAALEAEIATKVSPEEVEAAIATKANTSDVEALEGQIATKIDAAEVDKKVGQAVTDSLATAKTYTDGKVEAAISEHMTKKYEIAGAPEGTLVKMNENEIRIMCPKNCQFTKQNVGVGGDANTYYVTLKTYVYDDNVVGYKEHLGNQVDAEILTDLKTDAYGRRYQPTWLGVAKYDESTGTWNYYGANSDKNRYIGWDYQLDLYDANGVMVASDSIRINLSNEQCHSSIEPYYVGSMMGEVDTKIDTKIEEKIKEIETSYEIVEF